MLDSIQPALANGGIKIVRHDELDQDAKDSLARYFDENVYPVLTPLAVDPGHPFPMISNLSLNIAVTVRDEVTHDERNARVKVPNSLPRFLQASENEWILLEDLIITHLGQLFPGMTIGRADLFRVTRNADLTLEEDEADDLLVALEVELRRRRFGEALRVEIQRGMDEEFLKLLDHPAQPRRVQRLRERRHAWLERPVEPLPARSPRPEERKLVANHAHAGSSTANTSATSSPRFAKATSFCTTPTSPSPTRSSPSPPKQQLTRRWWASSRRSIAPRVTRRSWRR